MSLIYTKHTKHLTLLPVIINCYIIPNAKYDLNILFVYCFSWRKPRWQSPWNSVYVNGQTCHHWPSHIAKVVVTHHTRQWSRSQRSREPTTAPESHLVHRQGKQVGLFGWYLNWHLLSYWQSLEVCFDLLKGAPWKTFNCNVVFTWLQIIIQIIWSFDSTCAIFMHWNICET